MSFRYLTAGESHGKALVGILEGVPAGLEITSEYIHHQLKRRKLGYGRGARQKIETDAVEILSGVRFGKTLGSPIALIITNQDWKAWEKAMQISPFSEGSENSYENDLKRRKVEVPRPGHADLVGKVKYGFEDMRNVLERASARETAIRVGLGTVARRFLEELDISIGSRVVRIGQVVDESKMDLPIPQLNSHADLSPVRSLDPAATQAMVEAIECAKKEGNTLGGEVEVVASGVPLGLGSYAQWDRRLEGEIGKVFLSLNAIQGVEVGLGFRSAALRGSQVHDEIIPGSVKGKVRFASNQSGGITGGITTGQAIVVRAAMKPLSTLMSPLRSVHLQSGESSLAHIERSDVCAVPSAAVIGESLMALVLAGAVLEKFGGDSIEEVQTRVRAWAQASPVEQHSGLS